MLSDVTTNIGVIYFPTLHSDTAHKPVMDNNTSFAPNVFRSYFKSLSRMHVRMPNPPSESHEHTGPHFLYIIYDPSTRSAQILLLFHANTPGTQGHINGYCVKQAYAALGI